MAERKHQRSEQYEGSGSLKAMLSLRGSATSNEGAQGFLPHVAGFLGVDRDERVLGRASPDRSEILILEKV